jgi:CRP/FNR family transcriptional regulator, nitrogen oxide reductase regulator
LKTLAKHGHNGARHSATGIGAGRILASCSRAECLRSPFLKGLTNGEVRSILESATIRQYRANSVVITQGDSADHLFLLADGCARLFFISDEGRKVLFRWLLPGEILGAAALLARPSYYLVSTEMVKNSAAFVWPHSTIRNLAARYPKLLDNTLPFANEHLKWFLSAHMALVSDTARERLAHVLLTLSGGIGQKVANGIRVDITNEQLANAANITPFTASRILSHWQRDGVIVKRRCAIVIRAPGQLFKPNKPEQVKKFQKANRLAS